MTSDEKASLVYLAAATLYAQRTMNPGFRHELRTVEMAKAVVDADELWMVAAATNDPDLPEEP